MATKRKDYIYPQQLEQALDFEVPTPYVATGHLPMLNHLLHHHRSLRLLLGLEL